MEGSGLCPGVYSDFWDIGSLCRHGGRFLDQVPDRSEYCLRSSGNFLWIEFFRCDTDKSFPGTAGLGQSKEMGIRATLVFGIIFALGWTPCIGAFLGSALMLASSQGSAGKGILLLLCYSAGLGIPFLISAVLIQKLKTTFDWIKGHYGVINKVSGGLLIVVGILMMTGLMNQYLAMVS